MVLLCRIERLKRIDKCIRMHATGSPKEFAYKIGISESKLYEELNLLKELGAPILFNKYSMSYQYIYPVKLVFELQEL